MCGNVLHEDCVKESQKINNRRVRCIGGRRRCFELKFTWGPGVSCAADYRPVDPAPADRSQQTR